MLFYPTGHVFWLSSNGDLQGKMKRFTIPNGTCSLLLTRTDRPTVGQSSGSLIPTRRVLLFFHERTGAKRDFLVLIQYSLHPTRRVFSLFVERTGASKTQRDVIYHPQ